MAKAKTTQTANERITALEHSIYGNGAIGIRDQIAEIRSEQKHMKRMLIALLSLLAITIGGDIYTLIKHLLKVF